MDLATTIDKMFIRVAKVQTFAGGGQLTNATGFFYLRERFLYLITARHVVIDEAANHHPDSLQVSLHTDATDLRQRDDLSIPLYVDGVPQWRQHPQFGGSVDLVALAINDPHVLSGHFVHTFSQADFRPVDDEERQNHSEQGRRVFEMRDAISRSRRRKRTSSPRSQPNRLPIRPQQSASRPDERDRARRSSAVPRRNWTSNRPRRSGLKRPSPIPK